MSNPSWLFKQQVKEHEGLKEYILNFIEDEPIVNKHGVTKEDFHKTGCKPGEAPYFYDIEKIFTPYIINYMSFIGCNFIPSERHQIIIRNLWYHQYEQKASFNWHHHDGMAALIYYVESDYTTEFFDPYNKKTFMTDAKEGDILIMPSFLYHRSPPNTTGERKTIMAGNFNWSSLPNTKLFNQCR